MADYPAASAAGADTYPAEGRQKSQRWRACTADTCRVRPECQRASDPEPDAVTHAAEAAKATWLSPVGLLADG